MTARRHRYELGEPLEYPEERRYGDAHRAGGAIRGDSVQCKVAFGAASKRDAITTVSGMRATTRAIVALGVVLFGIPILTTSPAAAHFCSQPLQVPVGRPVTFTVGVPSEDLPVARVDIELPKGFEFHRAVEFAGWRATRVGNVIRYEGGRIRLFLCAFFTLAGEVTEKSTLVVPFVTYGEDGQKIQEFRSQDQNEVDAAQLVYAGIQPGVQEEPAESNRGALAAAGWALIGLGVVWGGFLLLRRRQRGRQR